MDTNIVHEGNNVEFLMTLPDSSVDLVYADPPFNTGRDFSEEKGGYTDTFTKVEKLPTGYEWLEHIASPNQQAYYMSIIPVLEQIHRILKPTGAYYHHCDYKTSHIARLLLNKIFGQPQYRNTINWVYISKAVFDSIKHCWKNNIDDILFYAKKDHDFEPQHRPITYKQLKEMYPYTDSKGRKFRYKRGLLDDRQYADENKGSRIETGWTDIPLASSKERTGYPTQKPLKLLKRIIRASSNEGDIVLDPFCGSGTTLLAAKMLKRKFIGIDQNPEAVYIASKRTTEKGDTQCQKD